MTTPKTFDTVDTAANLNVLSFDKAFARYMPNGTAPLFALTSELKTTPIASFQHGYFTKTMVFPFVTTSATALIGDTTLTVSDSSSIIPGMMLRRQGGTPAGEVVRVVSITNATNIVVTRAAGNVAASAVGSGEKLYGIGNAFEEASTRPQAMRLTMGQVTNYTQIFRNTWLLSGTQANIDAIAGDSRVAEDKADCMALHAADIEKALFWGQKSLSTVGNQAFHTMDGLESYIRTYAAGNIATAGSTTTYDQLEALLDPCFNIATDPKAGNRRVLFVGATAFKVINAIGRKSGQFQLVDGLTSFGMQFTTFKISRGTFMMIEHPLFNSNADWSKMAVAVDLSSISVGYLGNRKTSHTPIMLSNQGSGSDSSLDAVGGTLLTEMTLLVKNPAANAIVYGLTAAA